MSRCGKQYLKRSVLQNMVKRVVPQNVQNDLEKLIATKSKETKKNYVWHFYQFMAYNGIKIDDFKQGTSDQIKKWIGDYQNNILAKSVSYHKSFLASVQNVLTTLDRDNISLKKFRRNIPEEKTHEGTGKWKPDEIRALVELTTDKRTKAMLLLMAGSGVRIGSLSEMRMRDLTDFQDGCKRLVVYAESAKSRYVTFVAPDGAKAIDEMLEERKGRGEKLDDSSYLFVSVIKLRNGKQIPKQASKLAIKQAVRNLVEMYRRKRNFVIVEGQKRYNVAMAHGFRRFFKTALSEAKLESTNKIRLLGHSLNVNERYDSFSEEKLDEILFEDFKKSLPFLAIYKERYELESKSRELKEGKDEISKLQHEKEVRIAELENLVRQQQKDLASVGSNTGSKINEHDKKIEKLQLAIDAMIEEQRLGLNLGWDWKKIKKAIVVGDDVGRVIADEAGKMVEREFDKSVEETLRKARANGIDI